MFKRKGGGVKGLLTMLKKTALFLWDGFPNPCQGYTHQGEGSLLAPMFFSTLFKRGPSHQETLREKSVF